MPQPTVIKWRHTNLTGSVAATQVKVGLPSATVSGDTAWVFGQWGSGSNTISTIVDDLGGSLSGGQWVLDKFQPEAGHGQSIGLWRRSNCPAGVRVITVTFTSGMSFTQFHGLKANKIKTTSPIAGAAVGANPTGSTLAAGLITPGVAETFVIFFGAETSGGAITALTQFTAPADYTLVAADGQVESCAMWGYQSGSGSFNPTLTVDNPRSFPASAVLAVAYQTQDNVGASPSPFADVMFHRGFNFNGTSGKGPFGTTLKLQIPFPGCNAVCLSYDDLANYSTAPGPASRTASSPSNVWVGTTPAVVSITSVGFVYAIGNFNATGTLTLTPGLQPSGGTESLAGEIWGMSLVDTKNDDRSGTPTVSTTPPVTQNNMLSSALVTLEANEVILYYSQEDSQTVTNVTASNGTALPTMPDYGGYESFDGHHDCGSAILYAATPGSYNFNNTWTEREGNSDVVGPTLAVAISFQSLPPTSPPTRKIMLAPSVRRG